MKKHPAIVFMAAGLLSVTLAGFAEAQQRNRPTTICGPGPGGSNVMRYCKDIPFHESGLPGGPAKKYQRPRKQEDGRPSDQSADSKPLDLEHRLSYPSFTPALAGGTRQSQPLPTEAETGLNTSNRAGQDKTCGQHTMVRPYFHGHRTRLGLSAEGWSQAEPHTPYRGVGPSQHARTIEEQHSTPSGLAAFTLQSKQDGKVHRDGHKYPDGSRWEETWDDDGNLDNRRYRPDGSLMDSWTIRNNHDGTYTQTITKYKLDESFTEFVTTWEEVQPLGPTGRPVGPKFRRLKHSLTQSFDKDKHFTGGTETKTEYKDTNDKKGNQSSRTNDPVTGWSEWKPVP